MKIIHLLGCVMLALAGADISRASVMLEVDCAPDDLNARVQIWETESNKVEIADARKEHWDFKRRLSSVGEDKFESLFGKPSEKVPAGYAIPVFTHSGVGISGFCYNSVPPSFYSISDLGGVLIYPYGDGKKVCASLVYLKIDEKFTPVRSPSDYRARMDWDTAKLNRLRAWVEEQAKAKGIELHAPSATTNGFYAPSLTFHD